MTEQILPSDETFSYPTWIDPNTGTASLPYAYFWYVGLEPQTFLNSGAGDYADYPLRFGQQMQPNGYGQLFRQESGGVNAGALMTSTSTAFNEYQFPLVCRSTEVVNYDNLSYKATFGISEFGSGIVAGGKSGRDGSSPRDGGDLVAPDLSSSDTIENLSLGNAGGDASWETGGNKTRTNVQRRTSLWAAWRGNAIFFRVGAGFPQALISGAALTSTRIAYRSTNFYSLCVYPYRNSSTQVTDLRIELWAVTFSSSGSSGGTVRKIISQEVPDGAQYLDVQKPFTLRVDCSNASASPTADVNFKAYIGGYTIGGARQEEVQAFKDGVFSADTYTVGTDVTHNSTTGEVTDGHADRISSYADKTFGWSMGRDRVTDTSPYEDGTGASDPNEVQIVERIKSFEITDLDTSTVTYRDLFQRNIGLVPVGSLSIGLIQTVINRFGTRGPHCGGMFTFDNFVLPNASYNQTNQQLGKLLKWTDDSTTTVPNNYALADYDFYDDTAGSADADNVFNVMRQFVHLRPATSLINHSRSIEFRPGADNPDSGTLAHSELNYEIGICQRGAHIAAYIEGLVCYLKWTTDAASTVTYAELVIANRSCSYATLNPSSPLLQQMLARKKWSTTAEVASFNSTFPIYDGNWHKLDFTAEAYGDPGNPSSPAKYLVELDSTPIELDDDTRPLQSDTSSPFPVIDNAPEHALGVQEAFYFLADQRELDIGASDRNYAPMQVRNWLEGTLADDPGDEYTDPDAMASIPVNGEGSPTGTLNASPGALSMTGGGVWDVDSTVTVEFSYPIRRTVFDSGHAYTGPAAGTYRRRWTVYVRAASLALIQSLQDFYNSHSGIETPFNFVVPIPSDGYDSDQTAEEQETAAVFFVNDSLQFSLVGPSTYDAQFQLTEVIYQ